jgi:carbonic anhydrase/acetyltransferase-like protein (isoleucine patch superfamily)
MGSVLVGGAKVGSGSVIAAGAVLLEGMDVPAGKVVVGVPARVVRDAGADDARWTVHAAEHYVELGGWYRANLRESSERGPVERT